jgi:hypothetical protein
MLINEIISLNMVLRHSSWLVVICYHLSCPPTSSNQAHLSWHHGPASDHGTKRHFWDPRASESHWGELSQYGVFIFRLWMLGFYLGSLECSTKEWIPLSKWNLAYLLHLSPIPFLECPFSHHFVGLLLALQDLAQSVFWPLRLGWVGLLGRALVSEFPT